MSNELSEKLKRIESKIDSIKEKLRHFMESEKFFDLFPLKTPYETDRGLDAVKGEAGSVYMLKLPDSLRQTMFAMDKLREATTTQVAKETGRSRSVESIHLNQLERMGYLEKYRKGKRIYFKISRPVPKKNKNAVAGMFYEC